MPETRRAFDIWKSMSPRSRVRLALAVFFMFAAVGPITVLMESALRPIDWQFVLRQSLTLGGFAASVALFGRKRWWVTLLIVIAWMMVLTLNRGGLSFMMGEEGLRVRLGRSLSVSDDREKHAPVTLTAGELDQIYSGRGYLGALSMVLISVGYIVFIRIVRNELRERARLETEVRIARDIQQSLLPSGSFERDWLTAAGISLPASEVGGDFFDLLELPDGRVAAAIADVSGHGVGSGILAAMTKSALRSQLQRDPSPDAVFRNLNPILFDLSDQKIFVTFAYLLLDPGSRSYAWITAGHPPILSCGSAGGTVVTLRGQNPALGMKRDVACTSSTSPWSPGDRLLLYTDGVLEAMNARREQFGGERLAAAFASAGADPLAVCSSLRQEVGRFSGPATPDDDITMLALTFR